MKKQVLQFCFFLCCIFSAPIAQGQHLLPPDQLEQDACNALILCGNPFFTPYSYKGTGKVLDLSITPCNDSVDGGEVNSLWLKLKIMTAGAIVFSITPIDSFDDYDFAVLNISNTTCSDLSPDDVVRCNFNGNLPGSSFGGIVGLNLTSNLQYVQDGAYGGSFCQYIAAAVGETYLIMINNYGDYHTDATSKGFTIDFTGSTATFYQSTPPAFGSIDPLTCNGTNSFVTLHLTEPVLCSSIASDGSDFFTTPFVPISSAAGLNCDSNTGYTHEVIINFPAPLSKGNYIVNAKQGTDGNTLINLCNNQLQLPESMAFNATPLPTNFLPSQLVKCFYSTVTVQPNSSFDKYSWNTGATTPAINIMTPGTYTLQVTDANGCIGQDSISIRDSACKEYFYIPTAFTPNGDGKNDIFKPVFAGLVTECSFSIYNRLGQKIFSSNNIANGWDGTINGHPQPSGTYVWICSYQLYQQTAMTQKGTVVLIR